jgi:hypothetical protein
MLFYCAALPLSSRTLTFVAGIIRRHRISIIHVLQIREA